MFEVAKIIGKQNADDTLIPLMLEDLDSKNDDVRQGALENLGQFLEFVSEEYRVHFLQRILQSSEMDKKRNWRLVEYIALNLGHFARVF